MMTRIQRKLAGSYFLLIKDMASEITSMNDENFGELQLLLTEMNNLSKFFWTEKEKQMAPDLRNQPIKNVEKLEDILACHFCKQIGHKIKSCQIFQKSKMKKKLKKKKLEVNQITSNSKENAQIKQKKTTSSDKCVQTYQNLEHKSTQTNPMKILELNKKSESKTIQTTKKISKSVKFENAQKIISEKSHKSVVGLKNSFKSATNFKSLVADLAIIVNEHKKPTENESFINHNDEILKSIFQRFDPRLNSFEKKLKNYSSDNSLDQFLQHYFEKFSLKINEHKKEFNTQNNFSFLNYEKKRKKIIYQTELYPIIEHEIAKFLEILNDILDQNSVAE